MSALVVCYLFIMPLELCRKACIVVLKCYARHVELLGINIMPSLVFVIVEIFIGYSHIVIH
jgi:hypothetical protein